MKFNRKLLIAAPVAGLLLGASSIFADALSTDFETFGFGSVNGQEGWSATGVNYDQAIEDPDDYVDIDSFGARSLRVSNAVASGSFADWIFAAPLVDAAGEVDATASTFSEGERQTHFEVEFDIASAVPDAEQPGLQVSMAPDRGDGSRMSYLRFEDDAAGLDVFFDDVPGGTAGQTVTFNEVLVADDLDRSIPHHVRLAMDLIDGPSNDVVEVYIDGSLEYTGTSWENYYRFDPEANAEQSPRIIRTVIIQARNNAAPDTEGNGFLFDNLVLTSGESGFTDPDECRDEGWQESTNPEFDSERECIIYVVVNGEYDNFGEMISTLRRELRESRDRGDDDDDGGRSQRRRGGGW